MTDNTFYIFNNKLSFEKSMWIFARSMKFLESMREEDFDSPIPDKIEKPDDYYLKVAETKLAEFDRKSVLEQRAFLNHLNQESVNFCQEIISANNQKIDFLNTILSKIQAWKCCPEFECLKTFAIQQTQWSLDWLHSNNNHFSEIEKREIESYRKQLLDEITYHKRTLERENQKVVEYNWFLDKMREYFPLKK